MQDDRQYTYAKECGPVRVGSVQNFAGNIRGIILRFIVETVVYRKIENDKLLDNKSGLPSHLIFLNKLYWSKGEGGQTDNDSCL